MEEIKITTPVEDIDEELKRLATEHIQLIVASGYDPKILYQSLLNMFDIGYHMGFEDCKLVIADALNSMQF